MATTTPSVAQVCARAKEAAPALARLHSATKDAALEAMATALLQRTPEILEANARDMEAGAAVPLAARVVAIADVYDVLRSRRPHPLRPAFGPGGGRDKLLHRLTDAYHVLADLYRLAATELRQYGDLDLGWIAADRAMLAGAQSGDDLLVGACAASMTRLIMVQGEPGARTRSARSAS